jgi:hypothetical protein
MLRRPRSLKRNKTEKSYSHVTKQTKKPLQTKANNTQPIYEEAVA